MDAIFRTHLSANWMLTIRTFAIRRFNSVFKNLRDLQLLQKRSKIPFILLLEEHKVFQNVDLFQTNFYLQLDDFALSLDAFKLFVQCLQTLHVASIHSPFIPSNYFSLHRNQRPLRTRLAPLQVFKQAERSSIS